jgi:hypothetical protein
MELLAKRPIIYCNVIEAMQQLLQAVRHFHLPMTPDEEVLQQKQQQQFLL